MEEYDGLRVDRSIPGITRLTIDLDAGQYAFRYTHNNTIGICQHNQFRWCKKVDNSWLEYSDFKCKNQIQESSKINSLALDTLLKFNLAL